MLTLRVPTGQSSRIKRAGLGLGVTLMPIAALATAQYVIAPYSVAINLGNDPELNARAVSDLRRSLAHLYSVVALVLAIYWLLTAFLGGIQLLKIKSANVVLALSVVTFASGIGVVSFFQVPDAFRGSCPILGLPDKIHHPAGTFVFDGQSPCDAFLRLSVASLILGLPLILLAASAFLRILGSRRQ